MSSIFLSYARGDDESFVQRLYEDLTNEGFDVWLDRVSMPSRALTFHEEIRDAIMARDRLILVVGPGAAASEYVNQEWRWALDVGKCVNPIIRLNGRDVGGPRVDGYDLIPEELKLTHAEDFRSDRDYEKHLTNLLRMLAEPIAPLGKLVGVPSLPVHYRSRPDLLKQLRDVLLTDLRKPVIVTSEGARTGIHGMGGIGKTVLASALSRDLDVRRSFPDGVYWFEIGLKPNVVEIQRQFVKLLGGDPAFEDAKVGESRLRDLIEKRAMLVILDNVWDAKDADPFDVVGPRSKLLLTTRDAGLVASFAGTSYQIRLPSLSEARALLATAAKISVDELPKNAEQIIEKCGRLPLALALCGGMALKGRSWDMILRMLKEARLKQIGDRQKLDENHRDLWMTMDVSVSILPEEEQKRFIEMAVFCFDNTVSMRAVSTLWQFTGGLDDLSSEDLLHNLRERSLVTFNEQSGPKGEIDTRISLHDLLFDYVTLKSNEIFGKPATLHSNLVDAYSDVCPDGWHSGPNDGYYFQNLCRHLNASGRQDQVLSLLTNFSWIRSKVEAGLVYSLIEDYDIVSKRESEPEPHSEHSALALVQGALRLSSNILAQRPRQLPGQLVGRLLLADDPLIRSFIDELVRFKDYPWMRPITPSLIPSGGPLIRTLEGHTDWAIGVAVTPDSKKAVSCSYDFTVRVWDIESGKELAAMSGHTKWPSDLKISPDGKKAVTTSFDMTGRIWDIDNGKEIATLAGHDDSVIMASITSDNSRVVTCSYDKTLKVWDLGTGKDLLTIRGHTQRIMAVATTPDSRYAVSGSYDKTVRVWDLETGEELACLLGHDKWITNIAITADGRNAISCSADGTLKVWDLEERKEMMTLRGHTNTVNTVAIAPDQRRAVSASADGTLKVWDLSTGDELATMKGHTTGVTWLKITSDGRRVVSGSSDCTLKVWDIEDGSELMSLAGHTDSVIMIAVTPDDRRAVSASADDTLKVWDLESRRERAVLSGHSIWVNDIINVPGGRRAISCSNDRSLKIWNLESGAEIATMNGHTKGVNTVVATPDGRNAISCSADGTLKVWDLESGGVMATLEGHTDAVSDVVLVSGSKKIVSSSNDKTLKVWDLDSRSCLMSMDAHSKGINALAATPDGRKVISCSSDTTLKVWDVETGKWLATLSGHMMGVNKVAISPEGDRAISCSNDKTLKVWDLTNGKELMTLKGHTQRVNTVAITPDGRKAVSCAYDNTLKLWNLGNGREIMTLTGHTDTVISVAVTKDGRRAVSCSYDGTLKVWDLLSGKMIVEFNGEGGFIVFSVIDNHGSSIAGDKSGRIYILRVEEATAKR